MGQADAIQYCWIEGAHLPSARELAQLSMSLGATGIMVSCGSDSLCHPVNETNPAGSDSFNFSYAGYQRPPGDLGNNWFWSSSVYSYYPDSALGLSGFDGRIQTFYPGITENIAVRCVSGR